MREQIKNTNINNTDINMIIRTSASKKANQLAKYLKPENPDYNYLKDVFRYLRKVLEVKVMVQAKTKRETYIPTEEEIKQYYEAVWRSHNIQNMIIVKTILYTGIRVGELVRIKLEDVDLNNEQIEIISTKIGGTNRIVPIPKVFKEILAMHINASRKKGSQYLFELSWKRPYSDRAIRKISAQYSRQAGIRMSISPNALRNFLFTWMKKNNVEDALLQLYSGHKHIESLERYSKLATIDDVKEEYKKVIKNFPV